MFAVRPNETYELSIPEEGSIESWVQVAKLGKFVHPQLGPIEITAETFNQFIENAKQFNPGPIDYEHLSLKPKAERRPDDCVAAGWFTQDKYELRDAGRTLWGLVQWTTEAAQKIREKKFRYFSPTYAKQYFSHDTGKPVGARLLGGGLTNYPFLQGMAEVQLRTPQITLTERQQRVSQAFYEKFNSNLDDSTFIDSWMDEDTLLAQKGGKLFKVPFTVDDKLAVTFQEPKEAIRIVKELSQEPVIMPNDPKDSTPVIDLSSNPQFIELSNALSSLTTQVTTLSTENTTLRAEVDASKKELARERATNRVKALIRQGKLAKKQEEWAIDYCLSATPEQTVKWENSLDPIVKLNQESGSSESDGDEVEPKVDGIAAFQNAINEAMTTHKLSYDAAMKRVSMEQPEIFNAYRRAFNDYSGDGSTM